MQASDPIVKDLVLVGGGHSHAIALKKFAMNPLRGLRLTLITNLSHTPYSGMLPGHVAGFYSFDECHIDLRRLARFAGAQLYRDRAVGLDLERNRVICANRPPVAFDLLSLDIGSTPAKIGVPGATEHAIPAKPVPKFLKHWNRIVETYAQNPQASLCLCIVGGGAGGVELALTMQRRLQQAREGGTEKLQIHLFQRGEELLPGHNSWVSRRLYEILVSRGVRVHLGETVNEVLPDKVRCESGLTVGCDRVFWVTQASAADWIGKSGLQTDAKGFVLVDDTLRSLSHPHVFATGDIATMVNHPRPKAGVFAVRQGKPLFQNLRRTLLDKPLKPYKPQKWYLSLIGTGDEKAIASWGIFGWRSRWLWRWKDRIDRQFMQQFSNLPKMRDRQASSIPTLSATNPEPMRCAGCGSKVGSTILDRTLQRLQAEGNTVKRDDILLGLDAPDDAAVVQVPPEQLMVHTLDHFRSFINDPYLFGQIAANHSLSDIFAMGATPQSALAMVTVPYGTDEKVEETLYQLLCGAMRVLRQAQTPLVGGHTAEGSELAFGLACNGLVQRDRILRKSGMQPEQDLILTKALGTGTLFAADMRYQARGRWIDEAVESMLLSNREAAEVLREYGATACTDVTGFGLLGHLVEMVRASGVGVKLYMDAIPGLTGGRGRRILSTLYPQNLRAASWIRNPYPLERHPNYPLLFDPQTSGGLLAAIPADHAWECERALRALGYKGTRCIGQTIEVEAGVEPIIIA